MIPGLSRRHWPTETGFQVYSADWLRKRFEVTGDPSYAFWHHSANERIGALAGFRARMMGQSKGFPDFVCPRLRVAMELKVQGAVATEAQQAWLAHLTDIGWRASVCYNFETFRDVVLEAIEKARITR